MTGIMARVRDLDEALLAAEQGMDAVLLMGAAAERIDITPLAGRVPVWANSLASPGEPAGRSWQRMAPLQGAISAPSGRERAVTVVGALPSPAVLDALRTEGVSLVVTTMSGRAVDAFDAAELAAYAEACRHRGLASGLSGGIEAPDVVRLVALGLDVLVLRGALCAGGDPDGPLDREACRLIRDLVPRGNGSPAGIAGPGPVRHPDRIFVRDLELALAIGAYRSEIGRTQRVRFTVEADIVPAGHVARDLRDVVSYDLLRDAVTRATADGHIDYVETLAERIAGSVLGHPRVLAVRVVVEKLDVVAGSVGIEIRRDRTATA